MSWLMLRKRYLDSLFLDQVLSVQPAAEKSYNILTNNDASKQLSPKPQFIYSIQTQNACQQVITWAVSYF